MSRRKPRVHLGNVVRELPRHAHDLGRVAVRESQRCRMLEAVTEVVARSGYAEVSVADVIAIANVSRKTFYEHFSDKQACFLAAYDFVSDRLIDALVALGAGHAAGPGRRRAQLAGFLKAMASDPLVARVFVVDVLGAGSRALRRRERVNARFGIAILGKRVPEVLRVAIVGGANNVVAAALLDGEPDRIPLLLDALSAFVEDALRASR